MRRSTGRPTTWWSTRRPIATPTTSTTTGTSRSCPSSPRSPASSGGAGFTSTRPRPRRRRPTCARCAERSRHEVKSDTEVPRMAEALRLVLVASTCAPYARDAGRADVVSALADALGRRGHDVALFLPAHRDLMVPTDAARETVLARYPVPHGEGDEPASLIRVTRPGQPFDVFLVQHRGERRFFDGKGFAAAAPSSDGSAVERDGFFARAVLEALKRMDRRPDIVHAFDAQAAWVPALLRRAFAEDTFYARTGVLFSVLDWDDAPVAPAQTVTALGLAADAEDPWVRHAGRDGVPVLGLALRHADRIVFPSTRFATEVREDKALAGALSGVLAAREKDLLGVVPGIDARQW